MSVRSGGRRCKDLQEIGETLMRRSLFRLSTNLISSFLLLFSKTIHNSQPLFHNARPCGVEISSLVFDISTISIIFIDVFLLASCSW
jgi:hypothetical protein